MDRPKVVETGIDFLQCLETDVSMCIMSRLDDPADLVRASAVSHTWRHFMIANELSKRLCLKKFPQLSSIVGIATRSEELISMVETGSNYDMEQKNLEKEHEVYAALLRAIKISNFLPMDCIISAVSASSTDSYPQESAVNTLNPRDVFVAGLSHWSSKGHVHGDETETETLIYELRCNTWAITEVDIKPFEAFFEPGNPIYSANYVRFRVGYPKCPRKTGNEFRWWPLQVPADDEFVWTYTSPKFPMAQVNFLQHFKLPEPVLSIDGYLQIELLGGVQSDESDGLYYIRVSYVRVLGRPLYPAFDIKIHGSYEKLLLKYDREDLSSILGNSSGDAEVNTNLADEELLWQQINMENSEAEM